MANWFRKPGLIWIIAGLLLTASGYVLMLRNQNLGPEAALQKESARISSVLQEARDLVRNDWTFAANPKDIDERGETALKFKRAGVEIFVFRGSSPVYWTSNSYNLQPKGSTGIEIQKHYGRYLAVWNIHTDTLDYVFARDLIRNPELKALGTSMLAEEKDNKFSLSANPIDNSIPVEIAAMPLFYLVIDEFKPGIPFDIMAGLGLLIMSFGWAGIATRRKWYLLKLPVNLVFWLCIAILHQQGLIFWNLSATALFAPEVYASSYYFPNLGVLLFLSIWGYYFISWLNELTAHFSGRLPNWLKLLLLVVTLYSFYGYSLFVLTETAKLVRDSSVNFNFHDIHLVNVFSLLGLSAIVIWYIILFRLLQQLKLLEAFFSITIRRWMAAASFAFFYAWVLYTQPIWIAIFFPVVVAGLLLYELIFRNHKEWIRVGLKIVIPSLVTGLIFNRQIAIKELEVREILAAKLLLQNEKEPYNLLVSTEQKLLYDKGVVDYYTCTDETKNEFEKRLRQLYFSEYSEDFEILVFDYNAAGRGYREQNPFDYATINSLFFSSVCKPITTRFALVNERKLKGSYLGRFDVGDKGIYLGTYFVLLKPRISATQGRLADMFNKSPLEGLFTENGYSYAIYTKNKLGRRYGQFNYAVTFPQWGKDTLLTDGGFSHLTYSDELGNEIIISKPSGSILESLSGFTVLGIAGLFITLLYYVVILLRQFVLSLQTATVSRLRVLNMLKNRMPFTSGKELFLSSKLQVYVTLVVFITFVVVLFVTINYFRSNYTLRQKETLWNKTSEIANAIGTQASLEALFNNFQTGLIYDLSSYYNTDINLYDARGKLLISSNDKIYEQDILGNLMNPLAYRQLNRGSSGFVVDEQIGDLTYISAYYTILDNDLNIKGYLNLPYFSNRKDLYREISNYAVTIINLFALVFALAALVAYIIARRITGPLNLIRQQMGLVKLGLPNSPIEWQHNDEIGLLISQYNKMILELEESSARLAEGERQGAWKEMAKQVAHEIKNPLTPMKLSLQHLQYAIQRKDEQLEEKIKKTTELLITQIDSLSAMAEEFSSFAKMPEPRMEKTDLSVVLDSVIHLFEKEENVVFDVVSLPQETYVMADQHQLGRVFTNILKNAVQAIPEDCKGLIRIRANTTDSRVVISIEDNGSGIPETLRKQIFSPNFSTKNSGMGLGLAISKRIVELFGGNIDFQSVEGKGTTFFVQLPLMETT
jgi:signal transduction histidine kinase